VGIDVVDLERFRTVLARTPRLTERLFTEGERRDAGAHADPVRSFAARFAAKEATLKALGVGLGAAGLREIEVVRRRSGAPELELVGRAAALAAQRGVSTWWLSLTHSDLVAAAVVVAE
jgi:holo-[acyl-carrier protein] synthase